MSIRPGDMVRTRRSEDCIELHDGSGWKPLGHVWPHEHVVVVAATEHQVAVMMPSGKVGWAWSGFFERAE